jgi:Zn-finger protein
MPPSKIIHKKPGDEIRLVGCPAWPTTGKMAGATVEWCREARGKMDACKNCKWRRF